MFNSSVIDVGIGLIFVFLILGLMCTSVNEWLAQCFKMRAATLEAGIQKLLPGLSADFFEHALVKPLAQENDKPSYVPARTFAVAVIDLLAKRGQQPAGGPAGATAEGPNTSVPPDPAAQLARLKSAIDSLPDNHAKEALQLLLQHSDNQLGVFQRNLEIWFDEAMDRVSGWYKKKTQIVTAIVAVCITIFANADAVQIARKLFLNPTLREKIVQDAGQAKRPNVEYSDTTAVPTAPIVGESQNSGGLTPQERADLGELTGWSEEFKLFHRIKAEHEGEPKEEIARAATNDRFPGFDLLPFGSVFWIWLYRMAPAHLLGWFLTAVAVSLGAPFWFDTLNKFMNIRAAGTAPNEKNKDQSKA